MEANSSEANKRGSNNGEDSDGVARKRRKMQMSNRGKTFAGLIVTDRWGSPFLGSIPAALRILINALKIAGLNIYVVLLKGDSAVDREAKDLGVKIIYPRKKSRYMDRIYPGIDWLIAHESFFPKLPELKDVRLIFGFGMVTSDVALDMNDGILRNASLIPVNVWEHDTINHEMLDCSRDNLKHRKKLLDEEMMCGEIIVSVGPQTFDYIEKKHDSFTYTHVKVMPSARNSSFDLPLHTEIPKSSEFRILTFLEKTVNADITGNDIVPKAIKTVQDFFSREGFDGPPKWHIICMTKRFDADIRERLGLKQSPAIKTKRIYFGQELEEELKAAHLLLIPPRSMDCMNYTITAIGSGRPVLVPELSSGSYYLREYMPELGKDVVVTMHLESKSLQEKLIDVITNYGKYLELARKMKEVIMTEVADKADEMTNHLAEALEENVQKRVASGYVDNRPMHRIVITPERELPPKPNIEDILRGYNFEPSKKTREPCKITVHAKSCDGVPEFGGSMLIVEHLFYEKERKHSHKEGIAKIIGGIHPELKLETVDMIDIDWSGIGYILRCESMDALETLWSTYVKGEIEKKVDRKVNDYDRLKDYRASVMCVDIYIDVQEYIVCKQELTLLKGDFKTPSRRYSNATPYELLKPAIEKTSVPLTHNLECLNLLHSHHEKFPSRVPSRKSLLSEIDKGILKLVDEKLTMSDSVDELAMSNSLLEARIKDKSALELTLQADSSWQHSEEDQCLQEFVLLKKQIHQIQLTPQTVREEDVSKLREQMREVSIEASSAEVPVHGSVRTLTRQGSQPGEVDWANGIFVKENGEVVVTDMKNNRLQVLDKKNQCRTIVKFLALPKSFTPSDVVIGQDGKYYITDKENKQAIVSNDKSQVLRIFGHGERIIPYAICLGIDGSVYIADYSGYVRKYSADGEHLAATEASQISQPRSLIVNNSNQVMVSEYDRKQVHVLDDMLHSLFAFGQDQLQSPMGLCLNAKHNGIYVCDWSRDVLVHFTVHGEFVENVGQGQLSRPRFVTLSKENPHELVVTQQECIKLLYI
ncbi:uncharacterized protein [Ptychodera flava]|uniref:uncharacterized protein isoform X2 n=1 Tax=Ptychodera flava TaxID=63121 RepID=UPI00396A9107